MGVTANGIPDLYSQFSQFLSEFFKELDNDGLNVTDFYTHDGVFVVGGNAFQGHDGIRGFYAKRLENVRAQDPDAVRTSRHTFVNLRVSAETNDRATLEFINLTYAGEGDPPVAGLLGPSVISDCHLECVRGEAGNWLISRFEGEAIFIGSDPLMNKMAVKQ